MAQSKSCLVFFSRVVKPLDGTDNLHCDMFRFTVIWIEKLQKRYVDFSVLLYLKILVVIMTPHDYTFRKFRNLSFELFILDPFTGGTRGDLP